MCPSAELIGSGGPISSSEGFVALPHSRYTEAFNSGQWDGRKHFFTKRGQFTFGLSSWALEACASTGRTPTVEDLTEPPMPGLSAPTHQEEQQ